MAATTLWDNQFKDRITRKNMTYYSMIALTPTNEAWIPGYLGPTKALVAKHGGTYLARTASHEQIEGEPPEEPVAVRVL
ncbi:MAG: DUF1330 domain-containing protein, partial [Pseudomonadota bacterium]